MRGLAEAVLILIVSRYDEAIGIGCASTLRGLDADYNFVDGD